MNKANSKMFLYFCLLGLIFAFGIFLRLRFLSYNISFSNDESSLALNIYLKNILNFRTLDYGQMAPPLFMMLIKIFTKVVGFSDLSLRAIPFLAGCLSVIAFYFLAKTVLKTFSTIIATFFFAINYTLIVHSVIFKPYSLDVLFTILCLLFFLKLDITKNSPTKNLLYGLLLAITPWFSFEAIFVIAGGIINIVLKNIRENKLKTLMLTVPVLVSGLFFCYIFFMTNKLMGLMVSYWTKDLNAFVTINFIEFLQLFRHNIEFFFYPIGNTLCLMILLLWGMIILFKETSKFLNISCITFSLVLVASILKLYPFYERMILFLIPIFLLFILKPLDQINKKEILKSVTIVFLVIFSFKITLPKDYYNTKGREMMAFMVQKLKSCDTIFVNADSIATFQYYSIFYHTKGCPIIIEDWSIRNNRQLYNVLLKPLKKGTYWLYLPCCDKQYHAERDTIFSWAKNKNTTDYFNSKRGALLYVQVK